MTEPTKEEYQRALDFVSYALEHANEVTLQHDAQILVERALRLAANLPSEGEIERILEKYVYESGEGELQQIDVAAKLILKRIKLDLCDDEGCPHYGTVHICRSVK